MTGKDFGYSMDAFGKQNKLKILIFGLSVWWCAVILIFNLSPAFNRPSERVEEYFPPSRRISESPKVSDVCYHDPISPNTRIGRPFLLNSSSQKLLNDYRGLIKRNTQFY